MRFYSYAMFLAALMLFSGCGRDNRPNVLIVTLDTTRADRLGCYGYEKAHTPNLDRLAAEGARFEEAQAVMPITLPTHATIFTGYLPIEHGLRFNKEGCLSDKVPTMAEHFKRAGYKTAAFTAAGILSSKFGLDRGFDLYDDLDIDEKGSGQFINVRSAKEVSNRAIAWLRDVVTSRDNSPFMMWAHYYDPHIPRKRHPEIGPLKSDDLYDGEIAYMDHHIGRILKFLEAEQMLDNTLVIALADHGESLGEHGELLHGFYVYQGTQHIPLLMRWPGNIMAGARIKGTVSQTDIMPSVLDLAGLEYAVGRDLTRPLLAGSFADVLKTGESLQNRVCHMEALWSYKYFGWAPLAGLVEGEWSFVRAPEHELYDLGVDPGQTNNIAAVEARRADEMKMDLERIVADVKQSVPEEVSFSREEMKRFASLGYLAGAGDTSSRLSQEGDLSELVDPKTQKRFITAHNRLSMFETGEISDEILDDCVLLAEEFPENVDFQIQGAQVCEQREQIPEAIRFYNQALTLNPTNSSALTHLGVLYGKCNQQEKMLESFRKAALTATDDPGIQKNYETALWSVAMEAGKKGDQDKAGELLMKLMERQPDNQSVRAALKDLKNKNDRGNHEK